MSKSKMILSLPREAKENEYVGIDTEFFGMDENKLHRPHGTFACATFAFEDDTTYVIQDEHDIREALERVSKGKWMFHNAAFDIRQLRRYATIEPRRVWDIMLVEQGLFGGYYSRFSLGTMAARYLGVPLEKETREEFSKRTMMSQEMLQYAAKDAQATLKIGKAQIKLIQEQERSIKHYWLADHPAMWASMDMKPAVVDTKAWLSFATLMENEAARLESTFDFNPRSPMQVKNVLVKALRKPIESTDADVLEGLLEEFPDNETLRSIMTYRSYQTMASRYGKSWIEQHVENGRYVYTNWKIVGALTGRMACVSGDTSILTSNGYTAISQLQPGVKVFTHLGRWKRVTKKFLKGMQMMYKVVLSNGAEITCTLDHRLYTKKGWRKLRDVEVGDTLYTWNPDSAMGNVEKAVHHRQEDTEGVTKPWPNWSNDCGNHEISQTEPFGRTSRGKEGELFTSWNGNVMEKIAQNIQMEGNSKRSDSDFDGSWLVGMGNVQNFEGLPTDSSQELTALPSHSKETYNQNYRRTVGTSKELRFNCSWNFGNVLRFDNQSGRLETSIVCGVRPIGSNVVDHSGFRKEGWPTRNRWNCFLETVKDRNESCQNFTERVYNSCAKLPVLGKIQRRFLFTGSQFTPGDRWVCSFSSKGKKERQDKARTNEEVGLQLIGSNWNGARRSDITTNRVVSISSVGVMAVWDIEVENDHSYFAQGMFHHNSDSPNLQNIPSKKQPKYRDFFICDKGEVVMVMDVAQQEPRILCVLSDDAMLKNILLHGLSPHIELGKNIYNDPNFSKSDPRYAVAKSTNLGLSYGLTATGLARDTGISLKEAERVLKVYFQTFPGVQSYMNRYRHLAARQGYIETLLGRRSFINPYTYKWKNNAINSPIQGTAGDQMKIVMGLLHKECPLAGLEFALMMTVHDETVFRFQKGQRNKFEKLAEEAWREAGKMTLGNEIPLIVEVGVGANWGCKK